MNDGEDEARARAIKTYNAAADRYDDPANSFWERFGRQTVERLRLKQGARVLDVCCGSGASALHAAAVVGASGSVLGVDLAERLLDNARAKSKARGISNVRFQIGDLLDLRPEGARFDAVICVFGIFFAPDMTRALRSLWQCVHPRGKLAITAWGPRFLEPATSAFWNSIRRERPELHKAFNPWDRICEAVLAARSVHERRHWRRRRAGAVGLPRNWFARRVVGRSAWFGLSGHD